MTTENANILFEPFQPEGLNLKNRIVMAPMTRGRGIHDGHLPTEIMETYYEQRAGAGLIITEGIIISEIANGYINISGIYTVEQVARWKKITEKVHQQGGKIFAQIWHVGRVSHPDLLDGRLPVAPSAINPDSSAFTLEGLKDTVTPKEMTKSEIEQTIADFRQAAENAIAAGFDGIELHGANGYLFDQFLAASSNQRTDEYGGNPVNRARFLFEVLDEVTRAIGSAKTSIRLNPALNEIAGILYDHETETTYDYVINRLNDYQLAYIHLTGAMMSTPQGALPTDSIINTAKHYREIYTGNIIINNGFDKASGGKVINDGIADLVAFASPFIANPDLVQRYLHDLPLAAPDTDLLYQGGEKGYIDYPAFK